MSGLPKETKAAEMWGSGFLCGSTFVVMLFCTSFAVDAFFEEQWRELILNVIGVVACGAIAVGEWRRK